MGFSVAPPAEEGDDHAGDHDIRKRQFSEESAETMGLAGAVREELAGRF